MNKRIVFCGTPEIASQVLKSLYQNGYEIETVYTQPPIASNRGLKVHKSPVHLVSWKQIMSGFTELISSPRGDVGFTGLGFNLHLPVSLSKIPH